ncbi:hypothetical protein HK104_007444 [Borealophlyctis nickersoniae]|nr:hypothetical protein HK104_007444 [Borealophlyctis nickersoniae]
MSSSYITFELLHLPQLQSIPAPLWRPLHAVLASHTYGTRGLIHLAPDPSASNPNELIPVTAKYISRETVIVFPHDWVFRTWEDAERELTESQPLREMVATLLHRVDPTIPPTPSIQHILTHLPRITSQTHPPGRGTYMYVSFDTCSPSFIPTCPTTTFTTREFWDVTGGRGYTVMYVKGEKGLKAGVGVTTEGGGDGVS